MTVAMLIISTVDKYEQFVFMCNASMVLKAPKTSTTTDATAALSYGQMSMRMGKHFTESDIRSVRINTQM
ncbi:hypothetical protein HF325_005347 [Metschnikowia pulcherrima]|uniref:Uncharacterized protein n=1 Tax=Metschnikowia pulcherrima TaxID=27326 RepID=A0A8H7LA34_9ASCO|nr:hypothetical protein HF325_005347 [Metschnikowia pulcherrima]